MNQNEQRHDGLAVSPPRKSLSDFEKRAQEESLKNLKPLSAADLDRLNAAGKQPEPLDPTEAMTPEEIAAETARLNALLKEAGYKDRKTLLKLQPKRASLETGQRITLR
jgi:hypothetical protein